MNLCGLSPTFKPVLQQVSCVNTNFRLNTFTRESRHTRHLPQTFAKGYYKMGNLYRFCCKAVELLTTNIFATCNNLIGCKTCRSISRVVKRVTLLLNSFAAINVANQAALFAFPVLTNLTVQM